MNRIIIGDCRDSMRQLIADGVKVQCVVTSPPYWGLRNYGIPPTVWGGDANCAHDWMEAGKWNRYGGTASSTLDEYGNGLNAESIEEKQSGQRLLASAGAFCRRCGAWRGDLGLEPTPWMWLAHMVEVFDLVREVLADDGTCWVNLGDCHASDGGVLTPHGGLPDNRRVTQDTVSGAVRWRTGASGNKGNGAAAEVVCRPNRFALDLPAELEQGVEYKPFFAGVKQKDMVGTHWAAALALRNAGWWLRSDVIWYKKNPMPGSYKDRPTTTHEYLFLLSKRDRYYYDWEAIAEPCSSNTHPRIKMPDGWDTGKGAHGRFHRQGREKGKTHERAPGVTPKSAGLTRDSGIRANASFHDNHSGIVDRRNKRTVWEIASEPFKEAHFATFPTALVKPCILAGSRPGDIVMDPFGGSGTTAKVATELGRQFISLELNPNYEPMQRERVARPGLALA